MTSGLLVLRPEHSRWKLPDLQPGCGVHIGMDPQQSLSSSGMDVLSTPMSNRIKLMVIVVAAVVALGLVFYVRQRLLAL